MRNTRTAFALLVLLLWGAGCHYPTSNPSYYNDHYDFSFQLPGSWRGYSVISNSWDSPPKNVGPIFVFRNPRWTTNAPRQDVPVYVFTRSQWTALHEGKLWPSTEAGGVMDELWHNDGYVFAMCTRYNANDSIPDWNQTAWIVETNCSTHKMAKLYQER